MAEEKTMPMTPSGFKKLKDELDKCLALQKKIIEAIQIARAYGDLSENAEYHAAKEDQKQNEDRIYQLQKDLQRAVVIDIDRIASDSVTFGAWVTLLDEDTQESVRYQIVDKFDADAKQHKISIHSPIAQALIGKKVEDLIEVPTPKNEGEKVYTICKIDYQV